MPEEAGERSSVATQVELKESTLFSLPSKRQRRARPATKELGGGLNSSHG